MTPDEPTAFLTDSQVAARYPITIRTLQLWREKRRGPRYYRIGKKPFYTADDVEDYIRSCAVEPSAILISG